MNMTKKQSIDYLKDLWNEVYNEDSDGYNYAIALDMAIEVLSADAEWIPCSEKLPSDDDWVIVSIDYDRKAHGDNTVYWQNVTIAFYDGTWRGIESIGGESWVTAWMPLPKPYKGGDDK